MDDLINEGIDKTMKTYGRKSIVFEKGDGCYLFDYGGKKYLDFASGIAVNSLGYNNKKLNEAIKKQVGKLIHISNIFWNKPQIELASKLVDNSIFDEVFFSNSGAESIEVAIKLVRKHSKLYKGIDNPEIISFENSFHGRTLGALSATGQEKYREMFEPLLPGFKYAKYNDINSVREKISSNSVAVIVEVIQAEGGLINADFQFLKELEKLCFEKGMLLIVDEVQTGMFRLGELFGFERFKISPDIVCLAKGLAGGVPIGATLAKKHVAKIFKAGDHGSTFGGNALACSAANTVFDILSLKEIREKFKELEAVLEKQLKSLQVNFPELIGKIKGIGLLRGFQLKNDLNCFIDTCLKNGLVIISAGNDVVRIAPPLIINKKEIIEGFKIINKSLNEIAV